MTKGKTFFSNFIMIFSITMMTLGCDDSTTTPVPTPTSCPNECCEAHSYPGCTNSNVQTCVCAYDRYCCDNTWDQHCVQLVNDLSCMGVAKCLLPALGDCCEEHEAPGCLNSDVAACVCEQDRFCCSMTWDMRCVELVNDLACMGAARCLLPARGDCCEVTSTPGCIDSSVEACVCARDRSCCNDAWDATCVHLVEELSCMTCP